MINHEVDLDNPAFAQQDPHLHYDDNEAAQISQRGASRVPPLMDTMMNNVRSITKQVEHIKGFKFEVSAALSNNFHMTHSWTLPNSGQKKANPMKPPEVPHYTFGAQLVGGQILSPMDEPKFIMTGRMDSTGKLEAAIIKKISDRISLRLSSFFFNSNPQAAQVHLDMDYTGNDFIHTFKIGTGLMSFNYMQTIARRFVLGFECMNITQQKRTVFSYAARWIKNRKQQFYAHYVGPQEQLVLAYNHRILDRANIVGEFSINTASETSSIIGYRQKFSTSEVIATLNQKGKLTTLLSMNGMAYILKLCAVADYGKDSYKFGYGIQMGQVQ